MSLTLLDIISEAVIPAKAGIQHRKTGFRVKPGMTITIKRLMGRCTRFSRGIQVEINHWSI